MKKNLPPRSAFSLVEVILYIAISAMILVTLLLINIRVLEIRGENQYRREVLENMAFVAELMTKEVRDSTGINTGSFDSHPSSLTLNTDSGGTMVFNTTTKLVGTDTIRFVQVNDGTGAEQITSDFVDVTNFTINQLTRGSERDNLQLEITVSARDGSYELSLQTAFSIRE